MVVRMTDFRIVAPEAGQQFPGIPRVLFRNHDALHVGAANLNSRQQTPEMPTMNEHGDIVGFEKRFYDNDFGLRPWRKDLNETHTAYRSASAAARCSDRRMPLFGLIDGWRRIDAVKRLSPERYTRRAIPKNARLSASVLTNPCTSIERSKSRRETIKTTENKKETTAVVMTPTVP